MKRLAIIFFLSIVFYTTNAQVHVTSNGNVGIKTTSTSEELTVDGQVLVNSGSLVFGQSAHKVNIPSSNGFAYLAYSTHYNDFIFGVASDGSTYNRTGTFQASDINAKEDIKNIDSSLSKITQLKAVKFKYKDPKGNTKDQKERIGLIAQDVEKVFPQVVKRMEDGTLAVAYSDLVGALVEAIKEQQGQIVDLQKQVDKLTTKE